MQMQQAIQILQLSAQDLRAAIEKEYLENPVLEMDEPSSYIAEHGEKMQETLQAGSIAALADYLDGGGKQPSYFADDSEKHFEAAAPLQTTLEEELLEQVKFTFPDEKEQAFATFLVGSLDNRGYLTISLSEAARVMKVSEETAEHVLSLIQKFEPAGVGARDLPECLRLQAKRQGIYTGLVASIIDHHLPDVALHHIREIAAAEQVSPADVQMAVDIVKRFNPKPGAAYGSDEPAYITPDVIVRRDENGAFHVELEESDVPHLHISALYRQADSFDKKTKKYITNRLHAASWLIQSIEQRRTTIRHVVEEIVHRQMAYLEKGPAYLRPMTMKEVADAIGVHESTVSRAVANKYAELPNGIVALRSFFTARSVKSENGEEAASAQAKAAIDKLIQSENPRKPLSDQKICELLKGQNLLLSRRTVMKYREQLGYASSVKRKRY